MLTGSQGQPGASSRPPVTAQASRHGGTSPMPGQREHRRHRRPGHRRDRIREPRRRRRRRDRIHPDLHQQPVNNARTASARERTGAASPAPSSAGRPTRRDRPGTRPGRLRRQRRPDHLGQIRPPQQREHRQQHMRHPAPAAARPPRPHRHQPAAAPQHPRPGPPPPGQHTRRNPGTQAPRRQPPLDLRQRPPLP